MGGDSNIASHLLNRCDAEGLSIGSNELTFSGSSFGLSDEQAASEVEEDKRKTLRLKKEMKLIRSKIKLRHCFPYSDSYYKPILVSRSAFEAVDDLDFPVVAPANPKFVVIKLGRQVTKADTSKGHDTCLVLGNAILLLQDVVDLSMVESKEFKDLMVMQGIQSLQRVVANSEHMKKYSSNLKKANQRANTLVGSRAPSRHISRRLVCHLKELGTLTDYPTWTSAAPSVELSDIPTVYSPFILLGFNEEEYMNQLAEEENVSIVIVDGTDKREDKGNELGEGDGERAGGGNQDIPSEA
ncbi:hypothetical protein Acr_26g0000530 [Actinidia rufa]|uniref:Uncharacterized protein n=1 Tax=Actinidia rufa TaxID=165716 RepID=A0A7J0H118_9ERIC|nr:hypothetical protein Acr_26g0000530 [Actinidia rufa]